MQIGWKAIEKAKYSTNGAMKYSTEDTYLFSYAVVFFSLKTDYLSEPNKSYRLYNITLICQLHVSSLIIHIEITVKN